MKRIIIIYLFCYLGISLYGQEALFNYEVNNITELQYNLTDKHEKDVKYVNLLSLETSLKTDKWWKGGLFDVAFWSTGRTFSHNIAHDILTFSNIEEDNFWLVCSKLGYQQTIGDFTLFAGIRNMNQDYFTSPYSSFFTNSSAGIFPTISINYGVPNYPIGAFGLHAEYTKDRFNIKSSFYNNLNDINEKLVFKFHFNPEKYGWLNITQFAYTPANNYYATGVVLDKLPDNSLKYSLYALAEQSIIKINKRNIGVIGQLGYAPKKDNDCYAYYGAGVVIDNLFREDDRDSLGLITFRANTMQGSETATELSYKYTVNSYISIQPAFHYIHRHGYDNVVGLIRGTFTIGN